MFVMLCVHRTRTSRDQCSPPSDGLDRQHSFSKEDTIVLGAIRAVLKRMIMTIRHGKCTFWYCGGLLVVILWCIVSLKYISLPACIRPSVEQCLAHYSLSRPAYSLTNKHIRSELINHSEYHSWSSIQTTTGQCCRMIAGDRCALKEVKSSKPLSDDLFHTQFNSCASIQAELYSNYYVSQEELSFPLAYVALVHKEPHMLFRFLKTVYRRHNMYCIHYDHKSSSRFKSFIHLLSKCVDNIIIPRKIEDVTWGDSSILNAQLNCFRDLIMVHRTSVPWKYAFNLQGHELPLRTNRELVEMLQSQPPNTSIMETWPILDNVDRERFTYQVRTISLPGNIKAVSLSSAKLAQLPSDLGMEIFKSWCFIAATPHFVQYILESDVSKILANYLQNVASAEEYFYASLYNHKLTPGGRYQNRVQTKNSNIDIAPYEPPFAVSVSMWLHGVVNRRKYCRGHAYHVYCQFGVGDLKTVFSLYMNGKVIEPFPINNFGYGDSPNFVAGTKKAMFLNKYMTDTDPDVMDCLEERLSMQNMLEYYFDH